MSTNFNLTPVPVFRALSTTGQPLAGGLLYTYAAGTTTPLATYTDSTGSTANTNPIVLDATGSANVWLSQAAYKFKLTDSNNVVQYTVDQINAQPPKVVDVANYGAVGDGTTDDSTAFANAAAAAGSWGTVLVKRPSVSYKLGSNVTGPAFWALMGGATTSGTGTLGGLTIQQVSGGALNIGNFYINSSGDVGIGTNAPAELLDVAGNLNFPYVGGNPSGVIKWNDGTDGSFDINVTHTSYATLAVGSYIWKFDQNLVSPTSGYPCIVMNDGATTSLGGEFTGGLYLSSSSGISFNNGSFANSTFPTTEFQMGLGHNFIGASGTDCFFIMHRTNSTNVVTSIAIDQNGCVGIGGPPANTGSSAQSNAGLMIRGDGSTTTNKPLIINDNATGSTSYAAVTINRNGSTVGSISTTNTATTYNTSSDYRLKENLQPVTTPLDTVNNVPMYNGNFKSEPNRYVDFALAHEVQEFLPYAVTGVKDGEEMQQVDYSKLVPVLWAAVQQLSAEVERLKNGAES